MLSLLTHFWAGAVSGFPGASLLFDQNGITDGECVSAVNLGRDGYVV